MLPCKLNVYMLHTWCFSKRYPKVVWEKGSSMGLLSTLKVFDASDIWH